MIPTTYVNYFLGSTGASAALIGLLFVAISVAPERVFGQQATAERRTQAGSAFMALLDAFFVSLIALIPDTNIGYGALTLGVIGLFNTASLSRHFWKERHRAYRVQRILLLFGSVFIYGWEARYGVLLINQPGNAGYVEGLAYLLLGTYGLGVSRAWELLGAQSEGILTLLGIRGEPTEATADPSGEDTPGDRHVGAIKPGPRRKAAVSNRKGMAK